ncbi:MAG: LysM peptidoglycan-binding domain-containing protein [Anaerolineales bacterium]
MFDKRSLITLAIALFILGLTACVRPASTPPSSETTPTSSESFPLPGETEDVMSQLEQAATQTLMAAQGTPVSSPTPPVVAEATAVTPQETPAAEATSEVQLPSVPVESAPTATPVPLPSPTPGSPSSWTLQKGEHPYCIARRFDVNPNELLNLNGLSAGSYYYGGMVLKIPQTGNPFPAGRSLRAHPTNVTVSSGDTIYSIACEFGNVDPYAIAAANGISSPYTLSAGQNLYIP